MHDDAHTRYSLGSTPGPTDCSTQLQPPRLDSAATCRSRSLCPQACRQSHEAECPSTTWNGLTTQSRHQPRYFTCPAGCQWSPLGPQNQTFGCILAHLESQLIVSLRPFSLSWNHWPLSQRSFLLESDLVDSDHHFRQSHHLRKVPGSLFLQTFHIACSHRSGCSVFHRPSLQIYHQLAGTIRPLQLQLHATVLVILFALIEMSLFFASAVASWVVSDATSKSLLFPASLEASLGDLLSLVFHRHSQCHPFRPFGQPNSTIFLHNFREKGIT